MTGKVKISHELFQRIISLLESLELDDLDQDTVQLHGYVLFSLNRKKTAMQSRMAHQELYHVNALFHDLEENVPF
jgi:hypothetical protein